MTVTPMITRRTLASDLLDQAVKFQRAIHGAPEGTQRQALVRAGQLLRLVSQLVNNQTMTVDEGVAWRAAAHLTLTRMEIH